MIVYKVVFYPLDDKKVRGIQQEKIVLANDTDDCMAKVRKFVAGKSVWFESILQLYVVDIV